MRNGLRDALEAYLRAHLPGGPVGEAMAYAALGGGKRVRPLLLLVSAQAAGADPHHLLPAAAAVEAVHQYSLIHDDLPAMDDDDMRRGRPSCHKVFGEAMAILAGDGLLTWAFEELSSPNLAEACGLRPCLRAIGILAQAAGSLGMVGGQALDIQGVGRTDPEAVNRRKTGSLMGAAAAIGGVLGGEAAWEDPLTAFGVSLGLAFQAIDDVFDAEEEGRGGESRGALREIAVRHTLAAKEALAPLGARAKGLRDFADSLLRRRT